MSNAARSRSASGLTVTTDHVMMSRTRGAAESTRIRREVPRQHRQERSVPHVSVRQHAE